MKYLLALTLTAAAYGQTLTSTTLLAAVDKGSDSLQLAACSGIGAGTLGYMDREQFRVRSVITGCVLRVDRGVAGIATAHNAAVTVYLGDASAFRSTDAAGTCDATGPNPYINVKNGSIFNCTSSAWVPTSTATVDASNVSAGTLSAARLPATVVQSDGSGNVTIGTTVLSGTSGVLVPVTISTSGPVTVTATGFFFNNASGALTYTLPAITSANVGAQFCFRNAVTKTGAITLTAPASTYIDKDGANGSAAGTAVSAGAVGDAACVVAISTTQYVLYVGSGTWTNN